MGLHEKPASMLKESLSELLEASRYCVEYKKTDNGCLGYPGAILMFSIIDSIGSYHRGNKTFTFTVDLKEEAINKDGWEHFIILNSKYFGQSLSKEFIRALYVQFRNNLTHNTVLGKNVQMLMSNDHANQMYRTDFKNIPFFEGMDQNNQSVYFLCIKEFWDLCKTAVEKFIEDIDAVVPNSRQGKKFN